MADTLGTLVVRIAADIKALEAGMKDGQGLIRDTETSTKSLTTATDTLTRVYRDLAVAAVAWKAYEYVKDAAMLAARYETLGVSMKVVGQNAGYNAAQMEASAQGMQKMGISMVESRQQAMRLVQAHINLADSEKLARIAQDAAVIGNMNSSEAFAAMIHGIQSGQTDVLRTIGLNVSMEQSYKIMAGTLGKNVDALTQNEKTQSILNAVMLQGAGIAGTYEAAMDTAGKQINSMVRYTEDLKVLQGSVFNEILTVAVMAYTDHLKESNAELRAMSANGELKAWGMELAQIFVGIANAIDNSVTALKMAGTWAAKGKLTSGIADSYQEKMSQTTMGPFGAAEREKLAAQRDAEIKNALEVYEASQLELAGRVDRFDRAWDKRVQANADKAAKATADAANMAAGYNTAVARVQSSLESGAISEEQAVAALRVTLQNFYGDNHKYIDSDTGKNVAAKASEYDKLTEAIQRQSATVDEQLKYGDKLADLQKFELKTLDALENAYASGKITMAEWSKGYDGMTVVTDKMKRLEDLAKAVKVMNAEYTEYLRIQTELEQWEKAAFDARAQGRQAVADYTKSIQDQNDLTTLEVSLMGQTQQAHDIAIGQYRIELELKKQIEAIDKNAGFDEAQREQQRALARAAAAGASANVVANAELKAQTEMWRSIDDVAHQTFISIADGGKDTATRIRDSFKNILYDFLYQMTVKKWLLNIEASVSGSGGSTAGTGLLGGLSAVSGANSLYGIASGGYGAGVGALGTALFGQTAGNAALASSMGMATGEAAAAATAAAEAAGMSATAASGAAAAGTALAAAVPYVAAALIAYKVFFGDHGTPTASTGASGANYGAAGNLLSSYSPDNGYGATSATDKMVAGLQASYANTAKALGIGTVASSFNYAGNTGKNGTDPQFALGGSAGSGYFYQGETKATDADIALAASRAVFAALKGSDLPGYMSKLFDGLTASTATQQQITDTLNYAASLRQVRDELTKTPLEIMAQDMAALNTSAASFKTDFVAAIDAGIAPDRLAAWQHLGQEITQLGTAADVAAVSVRSAADILNERSKLQDQLDALTLTSAQLLAKQRDALDASTQGLFGQVQAAQIAKDAADALAQSTLDAAAAAVQLATDTAAAAAALASINKGWQDQLDILTGAQTDRSIALRDATDDSTRALMQQVYAQQDLKTAAEALSTGLKNASDVAAAAYQKSQQDAAAATSAAGTNANDAMAGVRRAVDAQKKIYQAQVDGANSAVTEIKGVFDTLASGIKTLYGQMDSTQQTAKGRAFIDNALSVAQKTGYLPDSKDLASAVQAAMQDGTVYASQAEADFAKLSLAGSMSALKDISGTQLSTAEISLQYAKDQLTGLDNILANAQLQLDAANGINTSVLSVADALAGLSTSIANLIDVKAAGAVATTGTGLSHTAGFTTGISPNTITGLQNGFSKASIVSGLTSEAAMAGLSPEMLLYNSARYAHITAAAIDAQMGWAPGQANAWAAEKGLPQFDAGTNYVAQDMVAKIHTGEAIIPRGYNPAAGGTLGNARLESLVEALTKEVQRLQGLVSDGNTHQRHTAETLDNVTEGGSNMRTVPA